MEPDHVRQQIMIDKAIIRAREFSKSNKEIAEYYLNSIGYYDPVTQSTILHEGGYIQDIDSPEVYDEVLKAVRISKYSEVRDFSLISESIKRFIRQGNKK